MQRSARARISVLAIACAALVHAPARAASDFLSLGIGWSTRLEHPVIGAPAVDEHRAYLALRGGGAIALALGSGARLWTADLDVAHAPAVDAGRVYVVSADELAALDGATGRAVWHVLLAGVTVAPVARGGWVLAGAGADLLAFRGDDGSLVWRRTLGSTLRAPVTVEGDRAYASLEDGTILAIDLLRGGEVWRSTLPAPGGAVTAGAERLFVGCTDNFFYALSYESGDRRWRWRTGADVVAPAVDDGSRVYFASKDNLLRALDSGSGVQRWRHALDGRPLTGPLLDKDLLLVARAAEIRAVRVRDGSLAGAWTPPGELAAPPVMVPEAPSAGGTRMIVVTGAPTGGWRVHGLQRSIEPAPKPLTEIPGRPLSPDVPPAPPGAPRPDAPPLRESARASESQRTI